MVTKIHDAVVTIQYVQEGTRTKTTWKSPHGLRRFYIGAEKTTGDSLGEWLISMTTLDPWKASLCSQARDKHFRLKIRYKETPFFDAALLSVEMVKDEAHV